MKPFRWNIAKREQLGKLISGEVSSAYAQYEGELTDCAAKILARSKNKKIIFIGRSPENIYDYLSGVLQGTTHQDEIDLLNISNRFRDIREIRNQSPDSYNALKQHFQELDISPQQITSSRRGICFSDLVASGSTFQQLFFFLETWCEDEAYDFKSVINKIGFIGITRRQKNSPNTWRWHQNHGWTKGNSDLYIKNVSVPDSLWSYLGDQQHKVTRGNIPEKWGRRDLLLPPREENNMKALRQAYQIFNNGVNEKKQMAAHLSSLPEIREHWLRALAMELKMTKA